MMTLCFTSYYFCRQYLASDTITDQAKKKDSYITATIKTCTTLLIILGIGAQAGHINESIGLWKNTRYMLDLFTKDATELDDAAVSTSIEAGQKKPARKQHSVKINGKNTTQYLTQYQCDEATKKQLKKQDIKEAHLEALVYRMLNDEHPFAFCLNGNSLKTLNYCVIYSYMVHPPKK
jgi:hypothetical protein